MPRYSYDNVIIIAVTNVIMLEFFSARFVRSGALQLTILSFLTFEVFKWPAGCIFKYETTKMKIDKNIKKWIFKQKLFCIIQYSIES